MKVGNVVEYQQMKVRNRFKIADIAVQYIYTALRIQKDKALIHKVQPRHTAKTVPSNLIEPRKGKYLTEYRAPLKGAVHTGLKPGKFPAAPSVFRFIVTLCKQYTVIRILSHIHGIDIVLHHVERTRSTEFLIENFKDISGKVVAVDVQHRLGITSGLIKAHISFSKG